MTTVPTSILERPPNLFIVGAPKCGTTSLHHWLASTPGVFMSSKKEPAFFADDAPRDIRVGPEEYAALFDVAGSQRWRGESSTWYLSSRTAVENISLVAPDARILVMLRHPVDAMVSLHAQLVRSLQEDLLRFEDAYAAQTARAAGKRLPPFNTFPYALQYRDIVRFPDHLRRVFRHFPRSQVHVVLLDDMRRDPDGTYEAVLDFLGVQSPGANRRLDVRNAASPVPNLWARRLVRRFPVVSSAARRVLGPRVVERTKEMLGRTTQPQPSVGDAFRAELDREVTPEIRDLAGLLGRDLSHWLDR